MFRSCYIFDVYNHLHLVTGKKPPGQNPRTYSPRIFTPSEADEWQHANLWKLHLFRGEGYLLALIVGLNVASIFFKLGICMTGTYKEVVINSDLNTSRDLRPVTSVDKDVLEREEDWLVDWLIDSLFDHTWGDIRPVELDVGHRKKSDFSDFFWWLTPSIPTHDRTR